MEPIEVEQTNEEEPTPKSLLAGIEQLAAALGELDLRVRMLEIRANTAESDIRRLQRATGNPRYK